MICDISVKEYHAIYFDRQNRVMLKKTPDRKK